MTKKKSDYASVVVPLAKKDIEQAGVLTPREARILVDMYYSTQTDRIRYGNQESALNKLNEPTEILNWFKVQAESVEEETRKALKRFAESQPMSDWILGTHGIGPVLAAGLLANISMKYWHCEGKSNKKCSPENPCTASCCEKKVQTAGQLWRYAGLDPTVKWEKGQKRPWNSSLKKLCYLIGDQFMKQSASEKCYYGHIYLARKAYEQERNNSGGNSELAKTLLPKYNPKTEAYKALSQGKLPDAQIVARARRYSVKMFLSHLHATWYKMEFGVDAPAPFAIAILGHAHYIEPPK